MRSPTKESPERNEKTGEYQSGQMGQTVNLLVYTFGGSNPSSPKDNKRSEVYFGMSSRRTSGEEGSLLP